MPKGHKKKGKFPVWTCIFVGLMILCGIIAGISLSNYIAMANPEGLGEILGYAVLGTSLAFAIIFGSAGFGCFIILIFIWGR